MMDLRRSLVALTLASLAGCGGQVSGSSDTGASADLINGTVDTTHTNVMEFFFLQGTQGYVCTTTLIGPQTALTAAHCWSSAVTSPYIVAPDGSHDLVVKGVTSPAFQGGSNAAQAAHDICVLHLAHPIYNLEPSMLSTTPPNVGEKVTMVGYGIHDQQGDRDDIRRSGGNWVWDVYNGYFEEDLTSSFMSTLGHGDSGGPAFVTRNGREEIAGIASRASGITKGLLGVDGVRAYHARVDYDYAWLKGEVGSDLFDGTHYATAPTGKATATLSATNATKDSHAAANQAFNIYSSESGSGAVEVTIRVNGVVHSTTHATLPAQQTTSLTLPAGTQIFDLEVADSATGVILKQQAWTVGVTAS